MFHREVTNANTFAISAATMNAWHIIMFAKYLSFDSFKVLQMFFLLTAVRIF